MGDQVLQRLALGFQEEEFAEAVARELATPGVTPLAVASRFVSARFAACVQEAMGGRLVKAPATTGGTWMGRFETLSRLAETGCEIWYPEIRFATKPADALTEIALDPFGIALEPIEYGYGMKRAHWLKTKALKTQVNHELRLNHVRIPPALFARALEAVRTGPALSQPYIANPDPHGFDRHHTALQGFRIVAFDHMIDGGRMFCACARPGHDRMRAQASELAAHYAPGSWPHRILKLLDEPAYRDAVCHLCVARAEGPEAAALRYGDDILAFEGTYIDQFTVGGGLDGRTALAEVQRLLGLSRWKSEAMLFQIVKEMMPDVTVQREASPPWLGRQRLDIFVPDLKLAIEYQGAQHFGAVGAFGGEDGFRRAQERDAVKKRLCEENGIALVHVLHTEPLTPAALKRRLQRFMRPG